MDPGLRRDDGGENSRRRRNHPVASVMLGPIQRIVRPLEHIRDRLAPFKRVRRLEFANLPKTISGKIRRVELRREEQVRAAAGTREATEFREEDFPELRHP